MEKSENQPANKSNPLNPKNQQRLLDARTHELQQANQQLQKEIAERRQVEAALRASEQRFRNTFEQSPSPILLLDTRFQIRRINQAFTELTGYSAEETHGRPLSHFLRNEVDVLTDLDAISPLQEGRKWNKTLSFQGKFNREIEVSMTIVGLFDSNHQLVEYIATQRDITMRRKLEKTQQRFMSAISHEIRTPLTNLILYVDLIKKYPKKIEYLTILERQVNRLQSLVKSVLEIAELTLAKDPITRSTYTLESIIHAAVSSNRLLAESRLVIIEVAYLPPDLPPLFGDTLRLTQATSEIIKNAISFTTIGDTVTITAANTFSNGSHWVTVSVHDNGPGIPAEELDDIFDIFYRGQVAEQDNTAGVGVGLSLAQAIVKAHSGRITVQSTPGQSSTFTIWLPIPKEIS